MSQVTLRLYIAGQTPRSKAALENLEQLMGEMRSGVDFDLEVINVLDAPSRAEEAGVFATPTLIKELPPPVRRIIGDLSDKDKVLLGLSLDRSGA